MTTEEKRDGQDDAVNAPDTDAAAGTPKETIEDAEIVSEVDENGDPVERPAETVADGDDAEADHAAGVAGLGVSEEPGASVAEAQPDADPADTAAGEDPDKLADPDAPVAEDADASPQEEPFSAGTTSEPPAEPEPAEPVAPAQKSGGAGVLSTVFGGALAAIVGFGAAQFINVDWMKASGFGPNPTASALEENTAAIAALNARLDEVQAAVPGSVEQVIGGVASELGGQFGAVSGGLDSLNGTFDGLRSDVSGSLEKVDGTVSGASERMAAVTASLDEVASALGTVDTRLTNIGDRLAGVDTRLSEVDVRLVEVEKRPLVESSDTAKAAFAVYEQELQELRQTLESQQQQAAEMESSMTELAASARAQQTAIQEEAEAQIQSIRERNQEELEAARADMQARLEEAEARIAAAEAAAEERAQGAVAQAALSQLEAALNAGISYEVALPSLSAVADVPAVFAENAANGIPTVEQLQATFDAAADDALKASITSSMTDDPGDRIMAFLRTQTGYRSTEAREGDDPDAVISRMDAAVSQGDLTTALAEYDALPADGQEALADWANGARARLAAEEALPVLADAVTTN